MVLDDDLNWIRMAGLAKRAHLMLSLTYRFGTYRPNKLIHLSNALNRYDQS